MATQRHYIVFTVGSDIEEYPIAEFPADDMLAAARRLNAEPDGMYRIIEVAAERVIAKTPWGWITEDRPRG